MFYERKKTFYYFYFILCSSRRIADAVYVRDCNTSRVYDGDAGSRGHCKYTGRLTTGSHDVSL